MIAVLFALGCAGGPAADVVSTPPAGTFAPTKPLDPKPLPAPIGLGRAATPEEIAAWDKDVDPSGHGLPPGQGDVATGRALFAQKCLACHGAKGEGTPIAPMLAGAVAMTGFADDPKIPRTMGNWWPYSTTAFDYVQRAMPQNAPGSLPPEETYALVAFLLAENGAVPQDFVADAKSLPAVKMPTKVQFVRDDREGTPEFR